MTPVSITRLPYNQILSIYQGCCKCSWFCPGPEEWTRWPLEIHFSLTISWLKDIRYRYNQDVRICYCMAS